MGGRTIAPVLVRWRVQRELSSLAANHLVAKGDVLQMRRLPFPRLSNEFRRVGRAALHRLANGAASDRRAIVLVSDEGRRRESQARSGASYNIEEFQPAPRVDITPVGGRRQATPAIPAEHTLFVVTKGHECFYSPLLADVPSSRLLVQPEYRGTAAAILYGVMRSLIVAPTAPLAIFPWEHYVADDVAFMRHIDLAFDGVRARPDLVVLLGITAQGPEAEYNWIEMGERI
ncbi:MAG: hypothetical protein JO166_02920, partial [Deltaproteobacteria bacterium]|nr:hypothetical protein [Deltaproteobacteria bacterium]